MEKWQLQQLQGLDLETKIRKTELRIKEWYEYWEGKVYISFSGGKDSTVLLDICRRLYPDIQAVFSDTGLEYPEIREFVRMYNNVTWIKPQRNFKEIITNVGYPIVSKVVAESIEYGRKNIADGKNTLRVRQLNGEEKNKDGKPSKFNNKKWKFLLDAPFKISNKCCYYTKKSPLHKFEKESGLHPYIGTTTYESTQREAQWMKFGCNAYDSNYPSSKPISFWKEQDILKYIVKNKLPISKVYGDIVESGQCEICEQDKKYTTTGLDRTGCMFCMFGCHLEKEPNRFQRMKITHPKQYEYCMKAIENGGLGMAQVLEFIGVPY